MSNTINSIFPGVNFASGSAEVVLWAPQAEAVEITIGSDKRLALQKAASGYWRLSTSELKPQDRYQFILDNGKPLPDPASRYQPDGVHGPSEAVDLQSYNFEHNTWRNPKLDDYIIYELHTGTFSDHGNFEGIISRLPYLKDLGITAIEIMPVAQFPGKHNWGYDGVFPYAVQNSYGGPHKLMKLVDACHAAGLAVILDVVYNHIGPEGNYFNEFGPYFTSKYQTPWGNAINFDDAWCDAVRNYFMQNVLMWFRDFKIDALRLDAVHAIKDFSTKHILQEMREAVDALMTEAGREHHLIIEFDLNDPRFINPLSEKGFGMDAQWLDEFHHALRVTAGGGREGYYADFEGIEHLAKAYRDAYVYDGIYSEERHKTFGAKTYNPGGQFVVFSQNHDHVGNRMLGERTSTLFSTSMQRLMAAAVFVSPYLPMLFMGEEYGETNPFLYFVSHTDPELIEAVRKGRKAEFKAFHAQGEAPDPQAIETFEKSRLDTANTNADMLSYYKQLIALRKNHPALHNNNRNNLNVSCDKDSGILTLERWESSERLQCIMNFSKQQQSIDQATEGLRVIFSSEPVNNAGFIQPESIIIYEIKNV